MSEIEAITLRTTGCWTSRHSIVCAAVLVLFTYMSLDHSRLRRGSDEPVIDQKQNGFHQADFLFSELNGITFACRCGAIHLVAFFLNLIGT